MVAEMLLLSKDKRENSRGVLISLLSVLDGYKVTTVFREVEHMLLPWHAKGSLMAGFF